MLKIFEFPTSANEPVQWAMVVVV